MFTADPDLVDVDRNLSGHLAFGYGTHSPTGFTDYRSPGSAPRASGHTVRPPGHITNHHHQEQEKCHEGTQWEAHRHRRRR